MYYINCMFYDYKIFSRELSYFCYIISQTTLKKNHYIKTKGKSCLNCHDHCIIIIIINNIL